MCITCMSWLSQTSTDMVTLYKWCLLIFLPSRNRLHSFSHASRTQRGCHKQLHLPWPWSFIIIITHTLLTVATAMPWVVLTRVTICGWLATAPPLWTVMICLPAMLPVPGLRMVVPGGATRTVWVPGAGTVTEKYKIQLAHKSFLLPHFYLLLL